jgi:hypothetical protein
LPGEFLDLGVCTFRMCPSVLSVWWTFFITTENRTLWKVCEHLFQNVPAQLADFVLLCLGKQPK